MSHQLASVRADRARLPLKVGVGRHWTIRCGGRRKPPWRASLPPCPHITLELDKASHRKEKQKPQSFKVKCPSPIHKEAVCRHMAEIVWAECNCGSEPPQKKQKKHSTPLLAYQTETCAIFEIFTESRPLKETLQINLLKFFQRDARHC